MALSEIVPIRFSPELLEAIDGVRGRMGRGAWLRRLASDAVLAHQVVLGAPAASALDEAHRKVQEAARAMEAALGERGARGQGTSELVTYTPGREGGAPKVFQGRMDEPEWVEVECETIAGPTGGPLLPESAVVEFSEVVVSGVGEGRRDPDEGSQDEGGPPERLAPRKSARTPAGAKGPLEPVVGDRPIVQKRSKK